MKKIAVITIGDEILNGSTLDKHLNYIGKSLYSDGIKVSTHITIPDTQDIISDTIKYLSNNHDVIISTGGLGPTPDDKTVDTIAKLFQSRTIINDEVSRDIEAMFMKFGREVNSLSKDQAYVIEGANFFRNSLGTAPGHYIQYDSSFNLDSDGDKHLFLLPGVPYEMRNLFDKSVKPIILELSDRYSITRKVSTFGVGESDLVLKIKHLNEISKDIDLGFYPQNGGVKISLTVEGSDRDKLNTTLDRGLDLLNEDIGSYIIEEGSVESRLVDKLRDNKLKISFGESCTGGLLSSKVVSVPGASKVMDRSFVTYSNQAKFEVLNVSPYTLELNGAVSEETVEEMLEGLIAETKSEVVAAVSGIAGPDGGSKEKPVGTVYVGIEFRGGERFIKRCHFGGDRASIQERTVNFLFNKIIDMIK